MIQLDITQEQLGKSEELIQIINKILFLKLANTDSTIKAKTCFDYYEGKKPEIVYKDLSVDFTPRIFNLAKPIVDIATKTFIGSLPDIVTSGNKQENEKISRFNQKCYIKSLGKQMYETAKNSSICGRGYVALYTKVGDTFPRFKALNPQFADVVYDCSLAHNRLFAFNIIETTITVDGKILPRYICYIYTKEKIISYECVGYDYRTALKSDFTKDINIIPYFAFRKADNSPTSEVKHNFNDIPIFEFQNNGEIKGDIEPVLDLISLYNDVQNNRALNIKQLVDYILVLKNVRIGNKEEQADMLNLLERHKLLPIEGEDVDARYLSNPLNQTEAETLCKSIKDCIHYIARVPDLSSVDFSQNASDPILKIKTKPLLDLCCEKELYWTETYLEMINCVMSWCKNYDKKTFSDYNFDTEIITLNYAHPLPSNDLDIVTQIANLSNANVLNPAMALQEISWIKNVADYEKGVKKWNEIIDKRKQNKENENIKANETNISRQNENPIDKGQLDNQRNGAVAMGNRISDNTVE